MLPPKAITRFALLVAVFFAALMWPWPAWERAYAAYFRGFGDIAFSQFWFWSAGQVRFLDLHSPTLFNDLDAATPGELPGHVQLPRPDGVKDTLMVLMNRNAPGSIGQLRTGSRYIDYGPTAVLLALGLATPIPWRRKAWLAAVGLVLVHVFIVVRLSLTLFNAGFGADKKYALCRPGPWITDVFVRAENVLADNPTVSFVAPFFIYLVALLGVYGWRSLRGSNLSKTGNSAARNRSIGPASTVTPGTSARPRD